MAKLDPVKMKDWQIAEAAEENLRTAADLVSELGLEEDEWERIKRLLGEGGRSIYDRLELSLNATDDDIKEAYSLELEYWQNKLRRAKVLENPRVQQQTEIILNVLQNLLDK
jgi:phosphoglycolate phosphatase-like HAD superfamily hydrolase